MQVKCTFWFYIAKRRQDWRGINDNLLLEIEGHQGDSWIKKSVCLPEGFYTLAFQATVGDVFKSDVAVDGVELTNESCTPMVAGKHGKR